MWFFFMLFTILMWAGSDLFSKMGSRANDKNSHWKIVVAVGLVMGTHAIVQVASGVEFSPMNILTYLPVSAMYIISMLFGYMGLRYIELSISSPICNSSGAVTSLLCFLILKETMTGLQFFAIILICTGVVSMSLLEKRQADKVLANAGEKVPQKYSTSLLAVLYPILYCIIDGIATFTDSFYLGNIVPELQANIAYEFTFLIVGLCALFYIIFIKKEKIVLWNEKTKLAGALCETAGQFTYVFAISANAIVAAPAISSYSILSVLLSRIFLKEKLSKIHYAIIAVVMVGVAILGIE